VAKDDVVGACSSYDGCWILARAASGSNYRSFNWHVAALMVAILVAFGRLVVDLASGGVRWLNWYTEVAVMRLWVVGCAIEMSRLLVPHGEECGLGIDSSLSGLADLKTMY
jgi:hypothetical protein